MYAIPGQKWSIPILSLRHTLTTPLHHLSKALAATRPVMDISTLM
jgi:hypothetical protein